jgi:hypothetical protein
MTRRFWLGFALFPVVGGAVGVACNLPPNDPPPEQNTDAQVHLGVSPGGGGGETSVNQCAAMNGVCMVAGDANICPIQMGDFGCTSAADLEAGVISVCCTGYDEAGAPDVIDSGG